MSTSDPSARRPSSRPDVLRWLRWLWAGGTAWIVASAALAAWRGSWMTVVFDQWPRIRLLLTQPFPANVLFPSNGHRQVFPGLLYLADLHWFGGHNRFLRLVGMALCFATAAVLSRIVIRDRDMPPLVRTVAACWIWLGLFWLANVRNLGHPFETVHVYLLTFAVALALLVVARSRRQPPETASPRIWLLAACCAVATFSFGQGAAVWVVALGLGSALRWPAGRVLGLAFALTVSVGLYVWVLPGDASVRHALLFSPVETPANTALWLGAPWFHVLRSWTALDRAAAGAVARLLAAVALAAVAVVAARRLLRRRWISGTELVGLGLSGFGLGAALITNLARTEYYRQYPRQIVASRYLVFSTLFWVGCLLLLGVAAHRSRGSRRAVALWIVVSAVLVGAARPVHRDSLARHLERKALSDQAALGLVAGVRDDAAVQRFLFRDPDLVYSVSAELRDRRWSMFDEAPARWLGSRLADHCRGAAEGVRGRVLTWERLPHGGVRIEGWAVEDAGGPPDHVVVVDRRGRVKGLGSFAPPPTRSPGRSRVRGGGAPGFVAYLPRGRHRRAFDVYAVRRDGETCVRLQSPAGLHER